MGPPIPLKPERLFSTLPRYAGSTATHTSTQAAADAWRQTPRRWTEAEWWTRGRVASRAIAHLVKAPRARDAARAPSRVEPSIATLLPDHRSRVRGRAVAPGLPGDSLLGPSKPRAHHRGGGRQRRAL